MMLVCTVPLAPITKKNHQQIMRNHATGKPFVMPSAQYKNYEQAALWHLKPRPVQPIAEPVNVKCLFYMPTRRRVDLTNLLESIDDILVRGGILQDDNSQIVAAHDGSRVMYDKDRPRTEITITSLEETP